MKIAYLISAYRDPEQLKNLVDALDECADFYIHIDKKVSEKPFRDLLAERSNVFFTPKRFSVQWGGYSQVRYQQELLRYSIENNTPYQRFVCLSGMDYPLFSNERIRREFTQNANREYICGMNITRHGDQWQRKKIVYFHCLRDLPITNKKLHKLIKISAYVAGRCLLLRKKPQAPLSGISKDVFMGSDYWAITNDCAQFVHDVMVKDLKFMRYFRRAFVPSELCIQTLVFNSPYAKQAMEFEERTYLGLVGLTPLHYIDYRKEIKVCEEQDLERLIASGKMFFRKASSTRSAQLMQLINRMR